MILKFIKKLMLPVRGSSTVERILVKDRAEGSSPSPGAISRRKFFSFMSMGAVMLAKPDLFLGPLRPGQFGTPSGTPNLLSVHLDWNSIEKEWQFWSIITGKEPLLPAIPDAPDGQALYSTTPWKMDLKEDQELKRLAGW